jgi:hypothetical protein
LVTQIDQSAMETADKMKCAGLANWGIQGSWRKATIVSTATDARRDTKYIDLIHHLPPTDTHPQTGPVLPSCPSFLKVFCIFFSRFVFILTEDTSTFKKRKRLGLVTVLSHRPGILVSKIRFIRIAFLTKWLQVWVLDL